MLWNYHGVIIMNLESKQKVFGIGFHKTGTTSLALALKILGYHCNRGLDDLRRIWGLEKCVRLLVNNDLQPYLNYIKDFDASLDNPWYLIYKELDLAFPGSKFILTKRDPEKWLASCTHFFEGTNNIYRKWMYGHSEIKGNEEIYLSRYRRHMDEVQHYFKGRPDDLIIVDWEQGAGWLELCEFLNRPIIKLPFPHLNKKGDELHSR